MACMAEKLQCCSGRHRRQLSVQTNDIFHISFVFLTTRTSFLPARCFNEESCLSLKQLEGYLVVLQPDAPQISLSGVGPHLARPAPEFEGPRGVPLFPELRIVCSLSHAVNTAAQGMEGGGESGIK